MIALPKAVKLEKDNYLRTSSIAHGRKLLSTLIDKILQKQERKYCIATITSAQTISSNYVVDLQNIVEKNGNFSLKNGKIKIPAGISRIKVSGAIFVDGWAGGGNYLWGQIKKNNTNIVTNLATSSSSYISSSIATSEKDVAEGDLISLIADAGAGGNLRVGVANTFLYIEAVE